MTIGAVLRPCGRNVKGCDQNREVEEDEIAVVAGDRYDKEAQSECQGRSQQKCYAEIAGRSATEKKNEFRHPQNRKSQVRVNGRTYKAHCIGSQPVVLRAHTHRKV